MTPRGEVQRSPGAERIFQAALAMPPDWPPLTDRQIAALRPVLSVDRSQETDTAA